MANVVLIYTGNVCSTPMVEFARLGGRIFVPVREQFDAHAFAGYGAEPAERCGILAAVIGAAFGRDAGPFLERPFFAELLPDGRMPDREIAPHTFFKWRTVFPDLPGSQALTEVFAAHNAAPVFMLRQSLSQQALKVQLSEMAYGGRHQQFKASELTAEGYATYLTEQAGLRIRLEAEDIDAVVKSARDFWTRTQKLVRHRDYYFPGRDRRAIIAEDIFRPEIDLDRYERVMGRLLGEPVAIPRSASPPIRKGGLEVEHCANAAEVLGDKQLVALEREYVGMLAGFDRVSGD